MHATARLRRVILRPFQGAGRSVAFIATGVLIQLGVLLVMALPWMLFVPVSMGAILLAVLTPLAAVVAAGPQLSVPGSAVGIPSPYEGPRPRLPEWLGSSAGRCQLKYHLLDGPLLARAAASVYVWIWVVPLDWRIDHPGYATWDADVRRSGDRSLTPARKICNMNKLPRVETIL